LTPKQKAFADYYIACGNATEAARKAGYSKATARQIATENLAKPAISQYIAERMENQDRKRVADADEVIEFYTSVMRGEVKDQFGLDAALSDRLKAGDSLMKRYAAAAERNKGAMDKLDNLLTEFRNAIKPETD
jgi:phage terminase small subunit